MGERSGMEVNFATAEDDGCEDDGLHGVLGSPTYGAGKATSADFVQKVYREIQGSR